jgi:hypothetical protein
MITILLAVIFALGIIALSRIIWVAISAGAIVLLAIPTFLILFIGMALISPWYPMIVAIIFIIVFNRDAKEKKCPWM